jgi:hypothetical protein
MTDGKRIVHVLKAVEEGRITQHEADAFLKATYSLSLHQARKYADTRGENIFATVVTLLFLCILTVLLVDNSITGLLAANTSVNNTDENAALHKRIADLEQENAELRAQLAAETVQDQPYLSIPKNS